MAATGFAARVAAAMIRVYQCCFSALKPPCCRFQPSCSQYARDAILARGLFCGGVLAVRRLLRCHPFYHGPVYDPAPAPAPAPAKRSLGSRAAP
jgi:putative membrane protein insertion efficiency factor